MRIKLDDATTRLPPGWHLNLKFTIEEMDGIIWMLSHDVSDATIADALGVDAPELAEILERNGLHRASAGTRA